MSYLVYKIVQTLEKYHFFSIYRPNGLTIENEVLEFIYKLNIRGIVMGKREQKAFVRQHFSNIQKLILEKIDGGNIPVSWGDVELKAYISLVTGVDEEVVDKKSLLDVENEVLMYAL